jgi:hypothetical protein
MSLELTTFSSSSSSFTTSSFPSVSSSTYSLIFYVKSSSIHSIDSISIASVVIEAIKTEKNLSSAKFKWSCYVDIPPVEVIKKTSFVFICQKKETDVSYKWYQADLLSAHSAILFYSDERLILPAWAFQISTTEGFKPKCTGPVGDYVLRNKNETS